MICDEAVNKITETDLNALYDRLKIDIEELRNELKELKDRNDEEQR